MLYLLKKYSVLQYILLIILLIYTCVRIFIQPSFVDPCFRFPLINIDFKAISNSQILKIKWGILFIILLQIILYLILIYKSAIMETKSLLPMICFLIFIQPNLILSNILIFNLFTLLFLVLFLQLQTIKNNKDFLFILGGLIGFSILISTQNFLFLFLLFDAVILFKIADLRSILLILTSFFLFFILYISVLFLTDNLYNLSIMIENLKTYQIFPELWGNTLENIYNLIFLIIFIIFSYHLKIIMDNKPIVYRRKYAFLSFLSILIFILIIFSIEKFAYQILYLSIPMSLILAQEIYYYNKKIRLFLFDIFLIFTIIYSYIS